MKKKLKAWSAPILAIFLTCLFPCLFLYFENAGEAALAEILPALGLFLVIAAAIYAVCRLIWRDTPRAAVMTAAAMLIVLNFTGLAWEVQKLTAKFPLRLLLLLLLLLWGGVGLLLYRKKPDARPICRVLIITFAGLILVNFALNAKTIIRKVTYQPKSEPLECDEWQFRTEDSPNVYYMIFDGYGGQDNLTHYFGYSNEEFLQALSDMGFSVSNDSHNPESVHTDTLIPNLLNLDYVVSDDMEIAMRLEHLNQPQLLRVFEENGYQINMVNHFNFLNPEGTNLLNSSGKETVSDLAIERSILGQLPFCDRLQQWLKGEAEVKPVTGQVEPDNILRCLETAKSAWRYTDGKKTFTICYFQLPHTGFYFREDGTLLPESAVNDWSDASNYLGQLKFTNAWILDIVQELQEKDPNALIVLQSDHGARYPCKFNAAFDFAAESPHMLNILNCVYYRGEVFEISGLTGINTWITLLNEVFGADFAARAVPEFAKGQ